MFNRRKSRNVNDTAYTGVNQNTVQYSAPPNSGALAAAISIGNNQKHFARSPSQNNAQPRTESITSSGSLLKRSSRNNINLSQPNRRFSNSSYSSSNSTRSSPITSNEAYANNAEVYDIDDSFNDSYLDEITEESTQVYLNNKANLQDLKLSHNPQRKANNQRQSKPVKMVKKYIPSPTGIKIIEVPESTYEKELARSNSMRSNSISRANSLRANANKGKISRSSSLQGVSKIAAGGAAIASKNHKAAQRSVSNPLKISENVQLEESLAKSDEKHEQEIKFKALRKEIEEEKKLAQQIESKRQEYERLKQLRLENERKLKDLETEMTSPDVTNSTILHKADNNEDEEDEVPIILPPVAVDELEKKKLNEKDLNNNENIEDNTLAENNEFVRISVPVLSDEENKDEDQIQKPHLSVIDDDNDHTQGPSKPDTYTTLNESNTDYKSLDPHDSELGIINQYNLESSDMLAEDTEKPKFDPTPAIITNQNEAESKETYASTLQPPASVSATSSKSSVYSNESAKKPMKSAMKNSSSFSVPHNQQTSNAAHQAYLSLTTAENTRLNSKLSNSQLPNNSDFALLTGASGSAYPQFASSQQLQSKPLTKSLSQQTMRKPQQPSRNSLRPQSIQQEPAGMSNRSLRQANVQPIAPHPALQPNYVSPSKAKAEELYAKAQARPRSEFAPLQKKSSFTREPNEDGEVPIRSPQRTEADTRTTLRDSTPSQNTPHATTPIENPKSNRGFKSRLADSDDEDDINNGKNFKSRFNDSDDDIPKRSQPQSQPQFTTLRKDVPNKENPEKGKKKFGKLRKLFGSKNN